MIVTFKDIKTGRIAKSDYPFGIWWWAEGNGSCDCNRSMCFEGLDEELTQVYGEGYCFGLHRCFAIDVEDHPDKTVQQQLDEVNEGTVERHHLKTKEDIIKAINEGLY